ISPGRISLVVAETEYFNWGSSSNNFSLTVPFPTPEGPESINKIPLSSSNIKSPSNYSSDISSGLTILCPTVSGCTADKITWELSVIMTALVRLPYVASINLLPSLAFVTIRFIGADSGDTIEIMLDAEIKLSKPIFISCIPNIVHSYNIRPNQVQREMKKKSSILIILYFEFAL